MVVPYGILYSPDHSDCLSASSGFRYSVIVAPYLFSEAFLTSSAKPPWKFCSTLPDSVHPRFVEASKPAFAVPPAPLLKSCEMPAEKSESPAPPVTE